MAYSGIPSSSAAQDTPPNTDDFAPAGTSAAARWRCAETVYNDRARDAEDAEELVTDWRVAKGTHRPEWEIEQRQIT